MNRLGIVLISGIVIFGLLQNGYAQNDDLEMDLKVSDEEKIALFGGFAIAIIAIFLFLARDIILRKKTSYDKIEFESKREKTFEKYHSDWGDDYEEMGKRKNTKEDREFRDAAINDELPNYYEALGVSKDATQEEIKKKFRELAKKTHPDKTKEDSEEEMAALNKAYEILSDEERRAKYDKYLKVD
jgi:molecular chaperone DnaJ